MNNTLLSSTLIAFAALSACSKPAEPLTTTQTAQPATSAPAAPPAAPGAAAPGNPSGALPPGHPPVGQMPAGHPPVDQGQPASGEMGPEQAGGLSWSSAAPLTRRVPASQMRAAEYGVSGEAGEAVLTVFYFGPGQGGSVQGNVDRWVAQVSQPDGKPSSEVAKITKSEVGGMPVTRVDVTGTFGGGMAPMMGQQAAAQTDQRVLGAIVEGPQGPVFFKLTGPEATVGSAEKAFDGLIASMKSAG